MVDKKLSAVFFLPVTLCSALFIRQPAQVSYKWELFDHFLYPPNGKSEHSELEGRLRNWFSIYNYILIEKDEFFT